MMIDNLAKAGPELLQAVKAFNAALQVEAKAKAKASCAEDAVGRAYEALRVIASRYNLGSW